MIKAADFVCDKLSGSKMVFLDDPWTLTDVVLLASEFDARLLVLFPSMLISGSDDGSAKERRFSILGHMASACGGIFGSMLSKRYVPHEANSIAQLLWCRNFSICAKGNSYGILGRHHKAKSPSYSLINALF